MKLKLSYRRPSGSVVDVVVTTDATATVGDLAVELVQTDPRRGQETWPDAPLTLAVSPPGGGSPTTLVPGRAVGEVAVASGSVVSVVAVSERTEVDQVAAIVTVRSGSRAGSKYSLNAGSTVLGRDAGADLVIDDQFVSKRHARIDVGDQIDVVDLNSANGLVVDGVVMPRVTLKPGQTFTIGDTTLSIDRVGTPAPSGSSGIHGGVVPFLRSPRVETRFPERELPRPSVPREAEPQTFPFLMLLAPIVMGTSMYAITRNPMALLFVAMAPLMMTGNYVTGRMRTSRSLRGEIARFDAQLTGLSETLDADIRREQRARQWEAPPVAEIYAAAIERRAPLWTRRPEHWTWTHLRLGTAALPSRTTIAPPPSEDQGIPDQAARLQEIEDRYRHVADVPVVESFLTAGALGVCGGAPAFEAMRGMIVQLVGLHSPAEIVVTALVAPTELPELEWIGWLPHTASPHSPIEGSHLADSAGSAASLIAELERILVERLGRRAADGPELRGALGDDGGATQAGGRVGDADDRSPIQLPMIVVVITANAPFDRARLNDLCERGAEAGILPLWLGPDVASLPAVCRTFVDVSGALTQARVHLVRHGVIIDAVDVEGVSVDLAHRFALALAPLSDAGAGVDDASDLPREVSLLSLLGEDVADSPSVVLDRWLQNASVHDRSGGARPRRRTATLRALVGQAGADASHLDLRAQGPHALVGGTTGAGKSEFLQAWVLGMAAEYSPDRVTFLFVDYKGGAAFADCVQLPHCVGLVTDLSPHLVRRALTSLRAELHHREHLLSRKQAKDLVELERRGDPDSPPALVIVIDEFAALVGDVPEFVDGVVDVAQRGRSLGIHLILATQRPAGVIRDNLRANTNLRIALRMADESDSKDVVGSADAAGFDPSIPGRGVVKSGPGRLVPFQSAYAGGHSTGRRQKPSITVAPLGFGIESPWRRSEIDLETTTEDPGPTDQVRLVSSIVGAASLADLPAPRRPWLDELSSRYDLADVVVLGRRRDTELTLGVGDHPERQVQTTVHFEPDLDGNLAIYGVGGAGKTVLLRTLAAASAITPRGGPVHVYGLDFAAGGLRMIDALPNVGSVVSGDDGERVVRLLRMLKQESERRAKAYSVVDAGSITDFRTTEGVAEEPRILVLLDGFPAFREAYEVGGVRGETYAAFQQLLSEGRQLGIHVAFTADRPASVPGSISASVPRRVVLRLAEDAAYLMLGLPNDILGPLSPPGRAIIDGVETQVAILGGSAQVADQARAFKQLAATVAKQGRPPAPAVRSLSARVVQADLPDEVDGRPVLGVGDDTLGPVGFEPSGTFLVGGGPASGRSNAVAALAQSLRRWPHRVHLAYLGNRRSSAIGSVDWDTSATDLDLVAGTARALASKMSDHSGSVRIVAIIESLSDFLGTPADAALLELIKAARRSDHLVIAESETSSWGSMYPLFSEMRASRRGILLQPEFIEGDAILKTPFPRVARSEFPAGRGMAAIRGRALRVQMPLADGGALPIDQGAPRS